MATPADLSTSVVDLHHDLNRERQHWRTTADTEHLNHASDILLARTITALTLLGANNETDAATTLKRVPDLHDATEEHRRVLARWVHHHYPPHNPEDGWTSGLQPDLLAETHTALALQQNPDLAHTMLESLTTAQSRRALTILTRAARQARQSPARINGPTRMRSRNQSGPGKSGADME